MTIKELAEQIGLPAAHLARLSTRARFCYSEYYKPKSSGGYRIINSPNMQLKGIQRWILDNVLASFSTPEHVHGFVKRRSITSNASVHAGRAAILCMDIKDFFPSVSYAQVVNVFELIVGDCETAELLGRLCCFDGRLPQGGVSSPALSNAVFLPSDEQISKAAQRYGVAYSRYADDLSFSSNDVSRLIKMETECQEILERSSFKINEKKSRLMTGRGRMLVTGLTLNSGKPSIGRERKRLLRAEVFRLIVEPDSVVDRNKVLGSISYLRSVERDSYERLRKYARAIADKKRQGHYNTKGNDA